MQSGLRTSLHRTLHRAYALKPKEPLRGAGNSNTSLGVTVPTPSVPFSVSAAQNGGPHDTRL